MKPIPIFFFAFANEEGRFLELLKQESSAVYNALYPVEEQGRLLIAREESLSSDELFLAFRRYKDRMFIFHFAGHAGSDVLGLEDLEANASHVADLLAEQKDSLKLVFLNGCATLNQVARLQELGIKAVIATSRPVEDDKAQFFAEEFYKNLATGNFTLKESFLQAKTAVAIKHQQPANLFRGIVKPRPQSSEFAWGLYAVADADLNWKITDPFLPIGELRKASQERLDELREGPFRYLKIEDALLKESKTETLTVNEQIIPINVLSDGAFMPLEESVERLWQEERMHTLLIGKGGMGKTVSLVHLWEHYLKHADQYGAIPLYLSVDEINDWNESKKNRFLEDQLRMYYQVEDLDDFLGQEPAGGPPNVILLLDSINYVNPEKMAILAQELLALSDSNQYPNLQIILTAQEDIRAKDEKGHWSSAFHLLELQPLTDEQIRNYLNDGRPLSQELLVLLRNPMMLSIFKASTQVESQQAAKSPFKKDITRVGELLYNVEVMARLSIREKNEKNPRELIFQRFILEHLLPYIGWTMYQAGAAMIHRKENSILNLRTTLHKALQELLTDDFFDAFDREYDRYLDERRFDLPSRHLFNQVVREVCVEKLIVLVEETEGFRFLHNLFRDYAAARHVLNQIDLALAQGKMPPTLRNAPLDDSLCRMIGQIEGEHRFNPSGQKIHPSWLLVQEKPNRIARMLDLCRGNFREQEVGQTVRNLLRIMALNREELAGADLQLLDLRKVDLSGIPLTRWDKKRISANFFGARISRKTLVQETEQFRKHFSCIHPDLNRVLFASKNGELLEWDIETLTCIQSVQCGFKLKDVRYKADGKNLLLFTEESVLEYNLYTKNLIQTQPLETYTQDLAAEKNPILPEKDMKKISRIRNRPLMYIQGCSLLHLHPSSQLAEEDIQLLRRYGALFNEKDEALRAKLDEKYFLSSAL
ncbi:MAG: hypothetical protein KIPDCIKN_00708 [Haliscomenobacter sp.]|nr:hypothetical protein [Haliscomenobacter sp.]